MLRNKIVNILVMLFLIISPLLAGGSQVLSQAAQASGGQPVLKGPYPNDTIGGTNSGTGQMRTTTQAMREAAAYQQKQQRGVSQNYAGIDKYNGLASPLEFNANASITPEMTPLATPDYFGVANWANSQLPQLDATGAVIAGTGIQKFVDALPGICGIGTTNLLGQCIPLAVADTTTFPGSDYYEIGLVQYTEQMHSNLAPTLLRGYVQIATSVVPGAGVPLSNAPGPDPLVSPGGPIMVGGVQVLGVTAPHYLGPLVLATRDRPVRVKFTNFLPTGAGGDLFLPTDTTYMGAGMGPGGSIYSIGISNGGAGYVSAPSVVLSAPPTGGTQATAVASINNGKVVSVKVTNGGAGYTAAPSVTIGAPPCTPSLTCVTATAASDLAGLMVPDPAKPGTLIPESYTQNRATLHLHGGNTPWISDGTTMQWTVPAGENTSYKRGDSVAFVPDMWYDKTTHAAVPSCSLQTTCAVANSTNDPGYGSETFYYTNQQSGRLMFYHDHAYGMTRLDVYAGEAAGYLLADTAQENALAALGVPGTVGTTPDLAHLVPLVIQDKTFVPDAAALATTDPTWDSVNYGGQGSLWFPHVYIPNQNPADVTGANAFGRWDYGPWFWPVQDPSTFVAGAQPFTCTSSFYGAGGPAFPPLMCPGTPNPSGTPEAFMDTPVINGTAYPTLTVDPTAYRFQILNAGNDRALNLGLYQADPLSITLTDGGSGYVAPVTLGTTGGGGSGLIATADVSTGTVTSILLTGVGAGYTSVPLVAINGIGTGAAAVAIIEPITSTVQSVTLTSGGSGYDANTTVVIDPPAGCLSGCTQASAIANVTPAGVLIGVTVTNPGTGWTSAPAITFSASAGSGAAAIASINTEVKMVDAVPPTATSPLQNCASANPTSGAMLVSALMTPTGPLNGTGLQANCWPSAWPIDGRLGGVPDPTTAGPAIIQIGTEGGLLPTPVAIPSTPIGFEYNRRSITVLNIFTHGLLMGPAERADVVVDFSAFAGKTLIVYNDAPTPVPAFDPRTDYFTGDPDQTSTGGAPSTLAGYGPNTRTLMQIVVNAGTPAAFNMGPLMAATGQPAIFATTQEKIIVPEPAFPAANGGGAATYARIQDTSMTFWIGAGLGGIKLVSGGAGYTAAPSVTIGVPCTPPSATCVTAVAAANLAPTSVASVTRTAGGSGYTSAPTVAFAGGGGSGAAATATLAPRGVASATITNQGNGYTSLPTVTFTAPQTVGTTATGTAVVTNRKVTGITITNPGSGYTAAPTITISGGGGTGAKATAVLQTTIVASVTLTNGGSGYTAAPTVSFLGGGGTLAAATATLTPTVVATITLTNPGNGYTSAPLVTLSAPQTSGSTALATALAPTTQLLPKTIQELFTLDYGRMNATLGVELPFTNFLTQTTIPYGYVDPPTELFRDGEIQIWKITHNGVDTHFIHFHLFTVQVINRVGWDGAIKPPDSNEVAWKDTVRMNPLEDIIVALRPLSQKLPWQLPLSVRPLDTTQPIGSALANEFTNVDPTNQPAAVSNALVNFGYEYVWHCHILGHEENDMMRAMVFAVPPVAPSTLTAAKSTTINTRAIKLSWTDNSLNETGFTVQRSITAPPNASWTTVGTGAANPGIGGVATFVDTTVNRNTTYWYQVFADNLVGYTQVYAAPAVGYPTIDAASAPTNVVTILTNNSNNVTPFSAGDVSLFLFASSFEAEQLPWTGTVGTVLMVSAGAMGYGGGMLGMAADLGAALPSTDGSLHGSFVFDHISAGVTTYDASFYFNPNGAVSGSSPVDIFVGLDQNGQQAFGIQYQRVLVEAEPVYQIRSWVQQNGNQAFSDWFRIANLETLLEVSWMSGTNAGLSLYANGFLTQTLTGDTSGRQLFDAVLGPSGDLSGASGIMYFDQFTSSTLNGIEYNIYLPVTLH